LIKITYDLPISGKLRSRFFQGGMVIPSLENGRKGPGYRQMRRTDHLERNLSDGIRPDNEVRFVSGGKLTHYPGLVRFLSDFAQNGGPPVRVGSQTN
jgi:hypothetical protein